MSTISFPSRRLARSIYSTTRRAYSGDPIKENETVLLKPSTSSHAAPQLIKNLRPGDSLTLRGVRGRRHIDHDQIIGKEVRKFVKAKSAGVYRIHRPTLGEYTTLSHRIVTPIYADDASLIVSLLDLHPTVPGTDAPKLEIFEAGTGHGALTLHLSRAIHAANTPPPKDQDSAQPVPEDRKDPFPPPQRDGNGDQIILEEMRDWRNKRRAVIHTLDSSRKHSVHAESTIRNFRDGMYYHNIDFHAGDIKKYLESRLWETKGEAFLDHAILDLPSAHSYMEIVGRALKHNGILITFVPSVTQIGSAVLHVKDHFLPFFLERTLEVGGMIGTGGREWDVRPVKPRALLRAEAEKEKEVAGSPKSKNKSTEETATEEEAVEEEVVKDDENGSVLAPDASTEGWEMVCRPKVGVRIVGGGFVGLWRKTSMFEGCRSVKVGQDIE